MKPQLNATVSLAYMTFLEAIRNRLIMIALLFAIVLIGLSVAAGSVSLGHRGRLIIDVGLAATSAISTLIAIALTVTSVGGELRRKTAYTLLTRPIPRWVYLLGKFIGITLTMNILVSLKLAATAGTVMLYGDALPQAFLGSIWLSYLEMGLVVAISLFFTTLAVPVLAATYSAGLIIAGNLAGDIWALAQSSIDKGELASARILEVIYYMLPDIEELSLRHEAANSLAIPESFLISATLYALSYGGLALVGAMGVFSQKKMI